MKRVPKLSKKKRDALAGAKNAAASAALSADEQQQQQDNFELYSKNLLVWVKNPYKKKSRLSEGDARLLQGLPPYDSDPVYRAEWLSQRKSLRPLWVQARVVSVDRATMMVNVETVRCHPTKTMSVPLGSGFPSTPFIVNEQSDAPSASGINNMVDMAQLHEASLLHNIEKRFHHRQIYTYAGDTLIAVNPYELISLSAPYWSKIADKCGMRLSMQGLSASSVDIYHAAVQQEYIKCPSPTALEEMPAEKRKKYAMPPHVFEVAHETFHALTTDVGGAPRAQSVVISGESGAGKTATTKLILSYLTALSSQKGAGAAASARQQTRRRTSVVANEFKLKGLDEVSKQILESNHILEAFGNAKTLRNDNSSRFGKFIEIQFERERHQIVGCHTINYLLEKSRIANQGPGERNFHIFYYMCDPDCLPAAEREALELGNIEDYKYAAGGGCFKARTHNDHDEYTDMEEGFKSLGFTAAQRRSCIELTAAVLHLGQLEFEDEGSSGSKPTAGSDGAIRVIARLLGVPAAGLAKGMTELVTDQFTRAFSPAKASETRDSLCKAIYSAVFDWLVHTCNVAMKMADATVETDFIGMLDIFGFEIFKKNGFEQLCINFANEKLQQMFNKHTFLLEEETYAREGVPFEHVAFYDSQPMLTFLGLPAKGKPKGGLFGILDEQTAVQSTDEKFLNQLKSKFGKGGKKAATGLFSDRVKGPFFISFVCAILCCSLFFCLLTILSSSPTASKRATGLRSRTTPVT